MTSVPSTPAEPHILGPPGSAPTLWPHCLNGRMPCGSFQLVLWSHRTLHHDCSLHGLLFCFTPFLLCLIYCCLPIGLGANTLLSSNKVSINCECSNGAATAVLQWPTWWQCAPMGETKALGDMGFLYGAVLFHSCQPTFSANFEWARGNCGTCSL